MFGPKLSLTIHLISYIGTTLLGTASILTPTVFFDYYKEQNGINNEDMKGFDMITGILAGGSFALLVNLCCLRQRGVILSFRKSWRESCHCCCCRFYSRELTVLPTFSPNVDIQNHKNPNHYYIPKSDGVRQASQIIRVEPRIIRYTMPPRIATYGLKTNMKRSYMKRDFPPIRDHSEKI